MFFPLSGGKSLSLSHESLDSFYSSDRSTAKPTCFNQLRVIGSRCNLPARWHGHGNTAAACFFNHVKNKLVSLLSELCVSIDSGGSIRRPLHPRWKNRASRCIERAFELRSVTWARLKYSSETQCLYIKYYSRSFEMLGARDTASLDRKLFL